MTWEWEKVRDEREWWDESERQWWDEIWESESESKSSSNTEKDADKKDKKDKKMPTAHVSKFKLPSAGKEDSSDG